MNIHSTIVFAAVNFGRRVQQYNAVAELCCVSLQLSVSVAANSTAAAAADKVALEQRSQAVQAFFEDRLGLTPADNTGAYLSYHIPAPQAPALPDFLQELEAAGPELGVSDVNIGLTSLEEVRHYGSLWPVAT